MQVERRVKEKASRKRIQDIVLAAAYTTTAVGVAVVAPNSVQFLKYIEKYIGPKQKLDRRISQAISRLQAKGLLERVTAGSGVRLQLTKMGSAAAEKMEAMESIRVRIPTQWDGKWRIVIFDVWESRRGLRDRLRILLQKTGFVKIQNSVWVLPYDCEELFVFMRTELRLGNGVLYIVADEIEHDKKLRQHFKLPIS